jgi:hypothetical protein
MKPKHLSFLIVHSPSPGYPAACCREEWRGDRAVARESEGAQGFGAIPLKIPRSLLRGASLTQNQMIELQRAILNDP